MPVTALFSHRHRASLIQQQEASHIEHQTYLRQISVESGDMLLVFHKHIMDFLDNILCAHSATQTTQRHSLLYLLQQSLQPLSLRQGSELLGRVADSQACLRCRTYIFCRQTYLGIELMSCTKA